MYVATYREFRARACLRRHLFLFIFDRSKVRKSVWERKRENERASEREKRKNQGERSKRITIDCCETSASKWNFLNSFSCFPAFFFFVLFITRAYRIIIVSRFCNFSCRFVALVFNTCVSSLFRLLS